MLLRKVCNLLCISFSSIFSFASWIPSKMDTFGSGYLVKFCNFYPHLSLETAFSAFELTQICCININIYFLESWHFGFPSIMHIPSLKDCLHNLAKYESKQNLKILISQLKWGDRNLEVQSKLTFKNPNIPFLSCI